MGAVLALITTARKASVSALIAFLTPPTALFISEQPITARVVVASVLMGLLAGLGTYETRNTRPYGEHAADRPDADR